MKKTVYIPYVKRADIDTEIIESNPTLYLDRVRAKKAAYKMCKKYKANNPGFEFTHGVLEGKSEISILNPAPETPITFKVVTKEQYKEV